MSGVTVVIPHWNRRDLLEAALKHLRDQSHPIDDVVVVDNGSLDGSVELAAGLGARLIRFPENRGFASAVNAGISNCRSGYVAVLNNDVRARPEWLACLVEALERQPDAWFATGKLLKESTSPTIDGAFDLVCRGACAWRAGEGRPDSPLWSQPRRVASAPFTAALFRRGLFDRIGLLDERFESYLEDVDFGLRCAQAGCFGVYVPEAVAVHLGSATLGRWHPDTVRRVARNQVILIAKHYPSFWPVTYGWPVMVAHVLWGLLAVRHGAGSAWLEGKWEGLRLYRAARAINTNRERLRQIFLEEESELRELQRKSGFDLYWRLYFSLT